MAVDLMQSIRKARTNKRFVSLCLQWIKANKKTNRSLIKEQSLAWERGMAYLDHCEKNGIDPF